MCTFLIFWSEHKGLGSAWGHPCFVLLFFSIMLLHYKWPQCCPRSLIQCSHFFFLHSDGCFSENSKYFFYGCFLSLSFDCGANELGAIRCFLEGSSTIRPVVRGNVFCQIGCGKIEEGKNYNFLNPLSMFSPFCVFVLIPRCFPHGAAAANLPPLHCAAGLVLNLCSYKHS